MVDSSKKLLQFSSGGSSLTTHLRISFATPKGFNTLRLTEQTCFIHSQTID